MKFLLDTHCFLWMFSNPERLNEEAKDILTNGQNWLYLSAASSWEISIKVALGKLKLPEPLDIFIPRRLGSHNIKSLPIEHIHAFKVSTLPPIHRDPFDRLLIAQAQTEKLRLLTGDPLIANYDVDVILGTNR